MEVSGRFFLLSINYSFPGKLLSVITGAIKTAYPAENIWAQVQPGAAGRGGGIGLDRRGFRELRKYRVSAAALNPLEPLLPAPVPLQLWPPGQELP